MDSSAFPDLHGKTTPKEATRWTPPRSSQAERFLVTGTNRGLGTALVDEALRRGAARVYAAARRPLTHDDARVTPLLFDITDPRQVRQAAAQVEELDVLVNNAALAEFDDLSDRAVIEQHLAVTCSGRGM